jgi:hypothetical protein
MSGFDYANVQSSDYGSVEPNGAMEVPTAWKQQNRQGYKTASSFMANRQQNFMMKNATSSPKSYATLTGGTLSPTPTFASAQNPTKLSFQTTTSPDYMAFNQAYTPATMSNVSYFNNIPSLNLSSVGRDLALLKMTNAQGNKNPTRIQMPSNMTSMNASKAGSDNKLISNKNTGYDTIPMQCISMTDSSAYDQCIKMDCDMGCTLDCLGEGDCQCSAYDEDGNCLAVDNPTSVATCSDKCFADYSTTFQPLQVAKQKVMMKNGNGNGNGMKMNGNNMKMKMNSNGMKMNGNTKEKYGYY